MMNTENNTKGTHKSLLVTEHVWAATAQPQQLPSINLVPSSLSSVKGSSCYTAHFKPADITVINIDQPANFNNALQLIREVRGLYSTQAILAILSYRAPQAKIECYLAGADHCIVATSDSDQHQRLINNLIDSGEWQPTLRLTLDQLCLHLCHGTQKLELSYPEVQALQALINAQGHILKHDCLADSMDLNIRIYGPQILEKAISRLRNKVRKTFGINLIHSVRGYGYRLLRGGVSLENR